MIEVLSADQMLKEAGRIGYYAEGRYICTCRLCKRQFEGNKQAISCLPCALKDMESAKTSAVSSVIERCAKVADAAHERNLNEAMKARTDAGQAIFDSAQATAATIASDIRKLAPRDQSVTQTETSDKSEEA